MGNLFEYNSPVSKALTNICYSAYLNILWFIFSIPIFTIGASTTALYSVSLKIVRNEEGNLTKDFIKSFKQNFKQSTSVWIILTFLGILLLIDGYILYHKGLDNIFWTILLASYFVACVAYLLISLYIYPLISKFENKTLYVFKNALIIGLRFLICSSVITFIHFIIIYTIIFIFTPLIIFGMGITALISSYLMSNIILQCEQKTKRLDEQKLV